MKRITKLSDKMRAMMPSIIEEYIARGLSTDEADWETSERAIAECYVYAGFQPPKRYVRVLNPLVLSLAAPIAAYMCDHSRGAVDGTVRDAVVDAVDDAVYVAVNRVVDDAVYVAVNRAVRRAVDDAVYGAVDGAVAGAVNDMVRSAVIGAVDGTVRDAVSDEVAGAVHSAVTDVVHSAVDGTVRDAVRDEVRRVVAGTVRDVVYVAVNRAVNRAVNGAVNRVVDGAVYNAVAGAVHGAVVDAVDGAVHGAVVDAVYNTVAGAVRDAVRDAVSDEVAGAVHSVVDGTVSVAVDSTVHDAVAKYVSDAWSQRIGGCWWIAWSAYIEVFRRAGLDLTGDLWARARSYESAQCASGWWWPHRDFVCVCDRPAQLHTIPVLGGEPYQRQLHRERGPAIQYRDGWGLWYLHGVRVEQWMVEDDSDSWTAERVLGVENVDQRREVVARYGIDRLWCKARIIDRVLGEDEYQLGELTISQEPRRYLCMRNRSIGVYHVEPVSRECRTVQQAHLFREGRTERQCAANGADYYQHGDVLFWPEGKSRFKPRPIVLT